MDFTGGGGSRRMSVQMGSLTLDAIAPKKYKSEKQLAMLMMAKNNLERPVNLTVVFLECERKLMYLERTLECIQTPRRRPSTNCTACVLEISKEIEFFFGD